MQESEIRHLIGDPREVAEDLRAFQHTARAFSSKRARLISRYPKQWVAVHDGQVRTNARTLKDLLRKVDELGLPRDSVMVRYIDKNLRKMIL